MKELINQAAEDLGIVLTSINDDFSLQKGQEYIDYLDVLKGRYSVAIKLFSTDLYDDYMKSDYAGMRQFISIEKIRRDFNRIKGKLDAFIKTEGYSYTKQDDTGKIEIHTHNTQSQSQNQNQLQTIKLDQVIEQISDNGSLPQEEIEEIISKLREIEEIVASKDTKPRKWQKIKEIGKYVLDKGIDVGIIALPYIISAAATL